MAFHLSYVNILGTNQCFKESCEAFNHQGELHGVFVKVITKNGWYSVLLTKPNNNNMVAIYQCKSK